MKPIVSSIISGVASMGVSTVVVNVVKNSTPKNLNLYSKLMVGLGTFVLSSVLADICADKLVEMIDEAMPVKPKTYSSAAEVREELDLDPLPEMKAYCEKDVVETQILYNHKVEDGKRAMGVMLLQNYLNTFMVADNPDLPGPVVAEGLIQDFCRENELDRTAYAVTVLPIDEFSRSSDLLSKVTIRRPAKMEVVNGS